MNIFKATADFERWLAKRLPIVRQDVALKHTHMAEAPFPFFRATFYRWIQLWPEVCPDLAKAPAVLAIGDLHIENFGTWRDEEGRLIWGVNDLDEAWPASYALDLVRLTTSIWPSRGSTWASPVGKPPRPSKRVTAMPWPRAAKLLSSPNTINGCGCWRWANCGTR